jgi:hypothetical protein
VFGRLQANQQFPDLCAGERELALLGIAPGLEPEGACSRPSSSSMSYCGELASHVDEERVVMTCTCGAAIVRTLEFATR